HGRSVPAVLAARPAVASGAARLRADPARAPGWRSGAVRPQLKQQAMRLAVNFGGDDPPGAPAGSRPLSRDLSGAPPIRPDVDVRWLSLCRERAGLEWQTEPHPHIDERFGERVYERIIVIGRRRDAQALGAARDGRIVDRLDVDAMLGEQKI